MANTSTLLLDQSSWDLVLDSNGNIAVASDPYSLAQDAASAIQTYLGECYWDTTVGVPWLTNILGKSPPLALVKAEIATAAMTVPDVSGATCFISSINQRGISGQIQVTSVKTGLVSVSNFMVINPQGGG